MESPQHARVQLLFNQNRYPEAEAAVRDLLASNPDDPYALLLMTIALYHQDREEEALGAVTVALRMAPDSDRLHAWQGRVLASMGERKQALVAAQRAVELDPEDPFNHNSLTVIYVTERRWKEVEESSRRALELDPDDEEAHHFLSQALLYMGKAHENESNIANRLADDPENPLAHCNAGYAALRAGDHRKASEHFAVALQIDASMQMARDGLIESFRSRSFIYRAYLAFAFKISTLSRRMGPVLMIGIYFCYRVLRSLFQAIDPRLGQAFVVLYLTFVFWTYVARGLSTFFLLADRFARTALSTREKYEAVVVGGGFLVGFILLMVGFLNVPMAILLTGAALMGQSIPASLFFDAEKKVGKWFYGVGTIITWACAVGLIVAAWVPGFPGEMGMIYIVVGGVTIMIVTIFAMFGFGRD